MGYKQPSQSEIVEICVLMLTFTEDDLRALSNNEEYPMIMRIIATRMIWERGFDAIEKILDRVIGKPRQSSDMKTNGKSLNPYSSMTNQELITIIIE